MHFRNPKPSETVDGAVRFAAVRFPPVSSVGRTKGFLDWVPRVAFGEGSRTADGSENTTKAPDAIDHPGQARAFSSRWHSLATLANNSLRVVRESEALSSSRKTEGLPNDLTPFGAYFVRDGSIASAPFIPTHCGMTSQLKRAGLKGAASLVPVRSFERRFASFVITRDRRSLERRRKDRRTESEDRSELQPVERGRGFRSGLERSSAKIAESNRGQTVDN